MIAPWLAASFAGLILDPASGAPPAPQDAVEGVVVTAKRPATQTLIDRKVYNTAADLQSTTGTAADLLNQIPSVDVDAEGNVSLRGDGNVTILLDGKPSAQFTGAAKGLSLQQLSGRDIDRIEVLASPPARYKAEGSGGVINIVTKKTRTEGLSGSLQANAGPDERAILGADVAYNAGKLNLSAGVVLRRDTRERRVIDDRAAFDPSSAARVYSHETLDEHLDRLIPSLKGGADYRINDKQSVGVSYSHRELSGRRTFDQRNESGLSPGVFTTTTDRLSNGREWSVDADANVHFEQKLRKPDETLSLAIDRSITREREHYDYTNLALAPAGQTTFDRLKLSLDLIKTEISVDYHLPLAHGRDLKLGYDFEGDDNAFDNRAANVDALTGVLIDNASVTSDFRYRQRVNAAYVEFEAPLGRWTLQSGLRLEQTDIRTKVPTGPILGAQTYFGAYPSLHLDRALSDHQTLSFSVSRRITRPDAEALNPFVDAQDIHNLRAGNAQLRPQDTWAYEVGYESTFKPFTYGLTAYLRDNRDSVTDVLRVVSADVVLATKANLPSSRAAGLEATASGKLGPKLSYSLSTNIFYSEIDASVLGFGAGLASTTGVNGKASLDWRPTPADSAQISFSRTDRRLTPQGYASAINLVNLGYRRQITAKLALVGTVTDLFDDQRFMRIVTTRALHDDYQRHQIGQVTYFGLVYSFGGDGKKSGNFDYER